MPELRMGVVAAAFAAGIVIAAYIPLVGCIISAAAVTAAACLLFPAYRSAAAIALALFVLGAGRYSIERRPAPDDISNFFAATAFEGTVAADPQPSADDVLAMVVRVSRVQMRGRWHAAVGRVQVRVYSASGLKTKPEYGNQLRILSRPYRPMAPTNPGEFSYRDYLARQGIYTCASVRRFDEIDILPGRSGSLPMAAALAAKRFVEDSVHAIHTTRAASLICGTVLGSYSYLPDETLNNLAATGTMHILAASGYNCFVLLFIAIPLLRVLRLSPSVRAPLVLSLLVLYVLIVGAKPSLVRASIMAAAFVLAAPLNRACSTRNAFFVAAFVVLMINPSDLFDVGFQLSFLAVWALLSVMPIIETLLRRRGLWAPELSHRRLSPLSPGRLVAAVAAAGVGTVAITLVTAPVMACNFNTFSLTALPANMAVALTVPLIFADGFASAVAAHVPLLGTVLGFAGSLLAEATLAVIDWFGSMKYSSVSVATPGALAVVGFYLVLYAGSQWLKVRGGDE